MATASPAQGLRTVRKITGWYIAAAVLFIVVGMFAIIEPALAGWTVGRLVGWLLVFGGATHLIGGFKGGGVKQVVLQILVGLAYVIGGFYCLTHPLLALGTLTLLLAAVILAGGVLEIISYFRLKRENASGWMLINGIIALLLGGMIWLHWPSSSVWAIGILVGVTLLMTGMARLMFGLAARRLIRQTAR
jgi:uncharacterized membrane protein HdeD (DUF308 family)